MGTENDELSKADFDLIEAHLQRGNSSDEVKENKADADNESLELDSGNRENLELNEGLVGNEEERVDPGNSRGDIRNEEYATDGDYLVVNGGGDIETEDGELAMEFPRGDIRNEEGATDGDYLAVSEGGDIGTEDGELAMETTEVDMDLVDSPVRQVNVDLVDNVVVFERVDAENSFLDTQNIALANSLKTDGNHVPSVKRKRITYDEQQPSVHVTYNSLTRASKQKLEELLQQWSEWHAQVNSSQDSDETLQSGEDTYFPALRVGMKKSSAVSFWIENQTRKQLDDGLIQPHSNSVPLYDRGYALGLTSADGPTNIEGALEIVDEAARCFNCGSYNHSLKECPKPRDNAAVNNARKQHKSKRNQNSGSRNPTRYYQSSSGGKYDGLKPGSLDAETRQLLGIGELDPPPWLNRMRELGYPPGYLDPDDEEQPSGITIFADEDVEAEQEDGEILETVPPEPQRKMSVEFPGLNAPIPESAEERLWEAGPSSSNPSGNRSHHRMNHSSEGTGRWHHHEQRLFRDFIDDGPPGVDSVFSPSMSSYPPRYGHYDSSHSSDSPRDLTPAFGRSHSDRARSSLVYEDFVSHGSSSYSSSRKRSSPWDIGSARHETDSSRDDYDPDYSYRGNDDHDRYRHRSRR